MKNFKKYLSLLLSLAALQGFSVFSSANAEELIGIKANEIATQKNKADVKDAKETDIPENALIIKNFKEKSGLPKDMKKVMVAELPEDSPNEMLLYIKKFISNFEKNIEEKGNATKEKDGAAIVSLVHDKYSACDCDAKTLEKLKKLGHLKGKITLTVSANAEQQAPSKLDEIKKTFEKSVVETNENIKNMNENDFNQLKSETSDFMSRVNQDNCKNLEKTTNTAAEQAEQNEKLKEVKRKGIEKSIREADMEKLKKLVDQIKIIKTPEEIDKRKED